MSSTASTPDVDRDPPSVQSTIDKIVDAKLPA